MNALAPTGGRSGFSRNLTGHDLSSHLQSVTATGGIHVKFFYTKVQISSRNAETNGQIETRLCVSKQPKGDRSTVAVRFITEDQAQHEYPHEFAMFKQYEEVPTSGTALEELPGISMSQIGLLVLNGLRSVEDLLEISEDQIGQLGLDAVRARKVAEAWMRKRDGAAGTLEAADAEARAQLQLEAMQKKMAAMEAHNMQLTADNEAMRRVQGNAAPAAAAGEAIAVNSGEDLETDISNMPDPFAEGPDIADGSDDLGMTDPDPLAG